MPELLQNESLQWIVTTLITVVLGIGAIFAPRFVNRKRKTLWYWSSIWPLVQDRFDERIQILFGDKPVHNVYMAGIGLRYKGNDPILEDDYRSPVKFDFGHAQILSAEITRTKPDGINVSLHILNSSVIVVDPIALNDGNELIARVLLAPPFSEPKVSGHIVGVKEIQDDKNYRPFSFTLIWFWMAMIGIGLAAIIIGRLLTPVDFTPLLISGGVLVAVGAIGVFGGLAWIMWDLWREIRHDW